jgi:hypothetical protein
MYNQTGFVVIGRYEPNWPWVEPDYMVRNPRLDLSWKDFLISFKGIEGDIWLKFQEIAPPTEYGELVNIQDYEIAQSFYNKNAAGNKCDLIFIRDNLNIELPDVVKNEFFFCGYELGNYGPLGGYWSSIAQEVVNGLLAEMLDFTRFLNEYYLLPDIETAKKLSDTRKMLCDQGHSGKELEDCDSVPGESCRILEIYCKNK